MKRNNIIEHSRVVNMLGIRATYGENFIDASRASPLTCGLNPSANARLPVDMVNQLIISVKDGRKEINVSNA